MDIFKKKESLKIEWSDSEMEEFDKEIDFYRAEVISKKNNKSFRYLSIGGEFKYLEDKGIVKVVWSKPWQEVKGMSEIDSSIIAKSLYQEFQRKLEFYFKWKEQKQLGTFGI